MFTVEMTSSIDWTMISVVRIISFLHLHQDPCSIDWGLKSSKFYCYKGTGYACEQTWYENNFNCRYVIGIIITSMESMQKLLDDSVWTKLESHLSTDTQQRWQWSWDKFWDTFVESSYSFLSKDLFETVSDAIVLRVFGWLVYESNLHDFKWLHHNNLSPSRYAATSKVFEYIKIGHYLVQLFLV